MALTFPRDMTTAHEWAKADFELKFRQEHSQQADGKTIGKDLGSPIWHAEFETVPMEKADAEALYTDFLTLGGLARTFYAHTAGRPHPRDMEGVDPLSPVIQLIDPDRTAIRISGLPTDYNIQPGDFIGVETQVGGRELHLAASSHGSGGDDVTGTIEITPPLRPSVATSDVVTLNPPMVELRMEKDGLEKPKRRSGNLYTVAFKARQEVK